jgi:glycosyltransferase involved in cell wall biosynthesis
VPHSRIAMGLPLIATKLFPKAVMLVVAAPLTNGWKPQEFPPEPMQRRGPRPVSSGLDENTSSSAVDRSTKTAVPSEPAVTVILPTRNEAGFIDRCLTSIFAADPVPGGIEVLVVDGMSDDGTRQILAEWGRGHPNLRVLDNPQRVVPTAMNIGIRAGRGEWIVRLDAHSEYPSNYLKLCLGTSQRTGADNVGGSCITLSKDDSRQGKLVRALTTHPFGVGNAGFRIGAREGRVDTVPYGCYHRKVFERIGWYDERLVRNQDYELNCRLRQAGGCIWYNPAISLFYYNQSTLKGLLRQAFVTGQWNPWMWFVAPYSFTWRHAVPLGFVVAMLSALLLVCVIPGLGQLALSVILGVYVLLALAASFQQSRRYETWMLPCLPIFFGSYHVAYGLGGLWGICLLLLGWAPVQRVPEPWPGAGSYRAWPPREKTAG